MIDITANNLAQQFNDEDNVVFINDCTIIDDLLINSEIYFCLGLVFNNCTFNHGVQIKNVNLNAGIRFQNCTIRNGMDFTNCIIDKLDYNIGLMDASIIISQCNISGGLSFKSLNNFLSNIVIEGSILSQVYINSVRSINGGLTVNNSRVNGILHLKKCKFSQGVLLSNVKLLDKFICVFTSASSYHLLNNNFNSDALFEGVSSIDGITFIEGTYLGKVKISNINSDGELFILNVKFNRLFKIEYEVKSKNHISISGFKSLQIGDVEFNNGFSVFGGLSTKSKFVLNEITISSTKLLKGDIRFDQFIINNLKLNGTFYDTNIVFDNIVLKNVSFDHFTNFGTIHFITAYCEKNKSENSRFSIRNSSLGNFFLTNISLENFNKINLENSDLSKIVANNVKWFSLKQLQEPSKINNLKLPQRLKKRIRNLFYNVHITDDEFQYILSYREIFRQLKHAMEQQGNRIQALVFKQYEMKFFHKELQLSKKIYDLDRIILLISCTNSHGQNWLKPALILLSLTLFFSLALILIINGQINDLNYSILTFKKIYFNLLDPTHSLQKMFGEQYYISGFMYAVDVLYKIIYAYLVFQTVSAFRKYIK